MAQQLQEESSASGSSTGRRPDVMFKLLGKRRPITTRKDRASGSILTGNETGVQSLKTFNVDDEVPGTSSSTEKLMIVKVILTSQNVPKVRIRREAVKKIKQDLQRLSELSSENPPPLVVVHPKVKNNFLRVECIGVDIGDFFAPLDGIFVNDLKVKVITKKILAQLLRILCITRYEHGFKVSTFLNRLQKAYVPLNTKDWYVIESLKEKDFVKMTFLIDQQSANYIEECGFALNWFQSSDEESSSSE